MPQGTPTQAEDIEDIDVDIVKPETPVEAGRAESDIASDAVDAARGS